MEKTELNATERDKIRYCSVPLISVLFRSSPPCLCRFVFSMNAMEQNASLPQNERLSLTINEKRISNVYWSKRALSMQSTKPKKEEDKNQHKIHEHFGSAQHSPIHSPTPCDCLVRTHTLRSFAFSFRSALLGVGIDRRSVHTRLAQIFSLSLAVLTLGLLLFALGPEWNGWMSAAYTSRLLIALQMQPRSKIRRRSQKLAFFFPFAWRYLFGLANVFYRL